MTIMLIVLVFMISESFSLPNAVDFGGAVLSTDNKHLSHDMEEHVLATEYDAAVKSISDGGADKADNDIPIYQGGVSEKQKEILRQVDDMGSNMVKRLLKNYESYQNVLSEKEEIEQTKQGLRNSLFMEHFHSVAGTAKTEDGITVEEDQYNPNNEAEIFAKEGDASVASTTNIPDQVSPYDNDHVATTPVYPEETNHNDDATNDNSEEMYDMSSSYASTMVHNADNTIITDSYSSIYEEMETAAQALEKEAAAIKDENVIYESAVDAPENPGNELVNAEYLEEEGSSEEREGRIMNTAGARRRVNGGGPVRISSGGSSNSFGGNTGGFHPRPVYPSSSSSGFSSSVSDMFSGFPTQNVHVHQNDELFGGGDLSSSGPANDQDVHVHVHMNQAGSPVSDGDLLFADDQEKGEGGSSVLDLISNFFG